MKIQVFDINHIINQIKCASPPSDKEMHKLINNLSILLEKNVTRKQSSLEANLMSTTEKLNEMFVDLCFLRKEIVQRFSKEYFEVLASAVMQLRKNKLKVEHNEEPNLEIINWDLKTMSQPSDIMAATFSKLHKARSVIEDALNKNMGNNRDPESMVEAFFRD